MKEFPEFPKFQTSASLLQHIREAADRIQKRITQVYTKSMTGLFVNIAKDAMQGMKNHTYGNQLYFNIQIKLLYALGYYHAFSKRDMPEDKFNNFVYHSYLYFRAFFNSLKNSDFFFQKYSYMNSLEAYGEHVVKETIYFLNMVDDFQENNYLIPFSIDKKQVEFSKWAIDSEERRICAILAEDLLLDYRFDTLLGEVNAYASGDRPMVGGEFHKGCEPLYAFIHNVLTEEK